MDGAPGGRDLGSCSHFFAVVFLSRVKSTNSDSSMAHGGDDLCRRENIKGGQFNTFCSLLQIVTEFTSVFVERRTGRDEITDRDDSKTEGKRG